MTGVIEIPVYCVKNRLFRVQVPLLKKLLSSWRKLSFCSCFCPCAKKYHHLHRTVRKFSQIVSWISGKKKKAKICCVFTLLWSQWTGFEPVRAEPNWFRVNRLNHSATTAWTYVMTILNLIKLLSFFFSIRHMWTDSWIRQKKHSAAPPGIELSSHLSERKKERSLIRWNSPDRNEFSIVNLLSDSFVFPGLPVRKETMVRIQDDLNLFFFCFSKTWMTGPCKYV